MAKSLKQPVPTREEFGTITSDTTNETCVHESGWTLYSIQTKIMETGTGVNVEETVIKIM